MNFHYGWKLNQTRAERLNQLSRNQESREKADVIERKRLADKMAKEKDAKWTEMKRKRVIKDRHDIIDSRAGRLKSIICFTCKYAYAEWDHAHCEHPEEENHGWIIDAPREYSKTGHGFVWGQGLQECKFYEMGKPKKEAFDDYDFR